MEYSGYQIAVCVLMLGMMFFGGMMLWAVVTQERQIASLQGVVMSNAQLLHEMTFDKWTINKTKLQPETISEPAKPEEPKPDAKG